MCEALFSAQIHIFPRLRWIILRVSDLPNILPNDNVFRKIHLKIHVRALRPHTGSSLVRAALKYFHGAVAHPVEHVSLTAQIEMRQDPGRAVAVEGKARLGDTGRHQHALSLAQTREEV